MMWPCLCLLNCHSHVVDTRACVPHMAYRIQITLGLICSCLESGEVSVNGIAMCNCVHVYSCRSY